MNDETIQTLIALNRRFYEDNAASFEALRQRPWKGWRRLLPLVGPRVLDVACGHGRFATYLAQRAPEGSRDFVGIDSSPSLLTAARRDHPGATWLERDVLAHDLADLGAFDLVVCFGLLHHVPGATARADLVRHLAARTAPGRHLVLALWRVDPSGAKQRPPPEGLDLEPGDLFLGWGPNPDALRYCHDVSDTEAQALIEASGLEVQDDFRDDGGGDRNRYLVLRREVTKA